MNKKMIDGLLIAFCLSLCSALTVYSILVRDNPLSIAIGIFFVVFEFSLLILEANQKGE